MHMDAMLELGEIHAVTYPQQWMQSPGNFFFLRSSMLWGLFVQTFPFSRAHRKKSGGVKSSDLAGQKSFEVTRSPINMEYHIQLCMDAKGGHFQHFMWRDEVSQGLRDATTTFDDHRGINSDFIAESLRTPARELHCMIGAASLLNTVHYNAMKFCRLWWNII
jgi:hypothetical protein